MAVDDRAAAQDQHECQRCGSDGWAWCDYRGCSECFEPESELCDDRSNPFPDGSTDEHPAAQRLRKAADSAHKRGSKELADDLHAAARRKERPLDKDGWPARWSDPTYLGDGPWGA